MRRGNEYNQKWMPETIENRVKTKGNGTGEGLGGSERGNKDKT